MKKKLEAGEYNTSLEGSDWRFAAAIVGLNKYFEYFEKDNIRYEARYEKGEDILLYNEEDITEERYFEFVEYYYSSEFHHKDIERMLSRDNFTEEDVKLINDKLKANTILKKTFGKLKFNGENSKEILDIIDKNRNTIIKETFRNKNNLYKNFCNVNSLLSMEESCCRLLGYNFDVGKKGKSLAYNFNKINFVFNDILEYDFIIFAFNGTREKFFINDNVLIKSLISSNRTYEKKVELESTLTNENDSKKILFNSIIELDDFINSDIEIIVKSQDNEFFETLYIREKAIKNLKEIKNYYKVFYSRKKITDDYWINVYDEVINCILNELRTDSLIELFLKGNERHFLVSKLIDVNIIIEDGGKVMRKRTMIACDAAKLVVESIPENKLSSYKQKLTSAIVFRDYERFCDILLQLSNYSKVTFDFAYDLFENFENNKDVAYSFVNALTKKENKDIKGDI